MNAVRVLREEAVGMYQVAVLEAGSAAALKRWMDDHGYKYPSGMDTVCESYVESKWCFVAVKTQVGPKSAVDPKPGMRNVQPRLPDGASFDGFVQAMGFRFRVKELVVPMRLSAFNAGELRNVVYLLTDGPRKIRSIPEEYIVRQIPGDELLRNLVGPLPLRVVGGAASDIPAARKERLKSLRDPSPHNGLARELFGADLLAARERRLSHPFEEDEKVLLRIGEQLLLRGKALDRLHADALKKARYWAAEQALANLKEMTLTVIDGDFPRDVLGGENLKFVDYHMPARRNAREFYHAPTHAPAQRKPGTLYWNPLSATEQPGGAISQTGGASSQTGSAGRGRLVASLVVGLALVAAGLCFGRQAGRSRKPVQ